MRKASLCFLLVLGLLGCGTGPDDPAPENHEGRPTSTKAQSAVNRSARVYRTSNNHWYEWDWLSGARTAIPWGAAGDIPVRMDANGDRIPDVVVFRPSTGMWFMRGIGERQWGVEGDIPVPADYDGDGRDDIAVWRPTDGHWLILRSSDGGSTIQPWGVAGDTPVPGDYDGDGRDDLAIWRPDPGHWWVLQSSNGQASTIEWGEPTDRVAQADYDGDGRTDRAIYRPGDGNWWILRSAGGHSVVQFGIREDIPVPLDYDGDGRGDIAVWRPSDGVWYILPSSTGVGQTYQWGAPGDVPIGYRSAKGLPMPEPVIDWRMPKRTFAPDLGCTQRLLPSADWISPSSWPVALNGCASNRAGAAISRYEWEVTLPNRSPIRESSTGCMLDITVPEQGDFPVKLTMVASNGARYTASRLVKVKDYLIVSMGDSVAAGEGNPDVRGPGLIVWNDTPCRRSWKSGHALAAIQLEDLDPHSSVTFFSTACSGDGIERGMLSNSDGNGLIQMDQVEQRLGSRAIDALFLQVGANDMGFGEVVKQCGIPFHDCADQAFGDGVRRAIDRLPGQYRTLQDVIARRLRLASPHNVFLGEYFDPSKDHNGNFCDFEMTNAGRVADWVPSWVNGHISAKDNQFAWGQVVLPLNDTILRAAGERQWRHVGGVASAYYARGYCSANSWIRNWDDSWNFQDNEKGTMHPNEYGHVFYGQRFAEEAAGVMAHTTREYSVTWHSDERTDRARCIRPEGPPPPDPGQVGACLERCDDGELECQQSCSNASDQEVCLCLCRNNRVTCCQGCGSRQCGVQNGCR